MLLMFGEKSLLFVKEQNCLLLTLRGCLGNPASLG